MPEEKEMTLEQMREKRGKSEVLYKKFTEFREYFETHAFCFYEGEDGKYYDSRIAQYWGPNFIPQFAGNKKEVARVHASTYNSCQKQTNQQKTKYSFHKHATPF